ncbi:hypothetical protein BV22DRAFT_1195477 [Leucogyrophana mollusca]|uniref:Uncharacterized protein n=1 Tax=Leucogyrophana mollusca TaxID=85980 RepID=A0ACB8BI73_9AGAM|nr:hypothetical protein BV22DRAFT_1195477 [Leucogyrophana mollusca]
MPVPNEPKQLTLYRFKASLFSHVVELALLEAEAIYKVCEIDLLNKPEWFTARVNPAAKVPAITYGGPEAPPEDPSPLAEKITESSVILQFIADIYPESGLLPENPILRARVRFFIDSVTTKLTYPYLDFLSGLKTYASLLEGIDAIQELLPAAGEYAVGNTYTIADATIVPVAAWLMLTCQTEVGKFAPGEARKLGEELHGLRYARFLEYTRMMLERPSTKAVFDEGLVESVWRIYFAQPRA